MGSRLLRLLFLPCSVCRSAPRYQLGTLERSLVRPPWRAPQDDNQKNARSFARHGGLRMTIDTVKFLFHFAAIAANLNQHATASETIQTRKEGGAFQQGISVGHVHRDRAVHRGVGREVRQDAAHSGPLQAESADNEPSE